MLFRSGVRGSDRFGEKSEEEVGEVGVGGDQEGVLGEDEEGMREVADGEEGTEEAELLVRKVALCGSGGSFGGGFRADRSGGAGGGVVVNEGAGEGEGVGASDCTSELGLSFAVDGFGFGENVVSGRELRWAKTQ